MDGSSSLKQQVSATILGELYSNNYLLQIRCLS
jgi:hypothetical protein